MKGGGAVPAVGTEVKLLVTSQEDLKRDILKSDSCMVLVPELELELACGSLGGVYSTVEGLINKIYTNLRDNNPFAIGDSLELHHSADTEVLTRKQKFAVFLSKLQAFSKGEIIPFTLILRDPLGNSFISAPLGSFLPPEMDTNLTMIDFERSWDENEEFGLNDINTKDYETGVDNSGEHVILADRITHVVTKGVDHPSFFAKGTDTTILIATHDIPTHSRNPTKPTQPESQHTSSFQHIFSTIAHILNSDQPYLLQHSLFALTHHIHSTPPTLLPLSTLPLPSPLSTLPLPSPLSTPPPPPTPHWRKKGMDDATPGGALLVSTLAAEATMATRTRASEGDTAQVQLPSRSQHTLTYHNTPSSLTKNTIPFHISLSSSSSSSSSLPSRISQSLTLSYRRPLPPSHSLIMFPYHFRRSVCLPLMGGKP